MIDIQTLTLLPQDQLMLASTAESRALHRYRRLALSFLTYSTALSRQMAELGIACEQRLETLREAANDLGLGACVDGPEHPRARPTLVDSRGSFFIVDGELIDQALQQALAASLETHRLARRLLGANGTPELERPLRDYTYHKQLESGVLMHCYAAHQQLS
ncbi:hypothetical protein [Halomonas sp. 328]|uniref:hypothetical protein n=1 Tax=Halomonas sp. 328 TaxID=2776704 RepID=UPI0018A78BFC|nr:hypothetical protein [Halomonas sp. 328]MBF8221840.1 hypothetical protein [Halomonas sp. 328]